VILVDDDPVVANTLSAQLAAAGYRVAVESTAAGLIETLVSGGDGIDLVFCDLMLTGMSGMDLRDALAARAPSQVAKVVFMTGGAFTPRARAFRERHADQCVDKPFDVVEEASRRIRARRTT
jgi:CheY-like chemotaxis protein